MITRLVHQCSGKVLCFTDCYAGIKAIGGLVRRRDRQLFDRFRIFIFRVISVGLVTTQQRAFRYRLSGVTGVTFRGSNYSQMTHTLLLGESQRGARRLSQAGYAELSGGSAADQNQPLRLKAYRSVQQRCVAQLSRELIPDIQFRGQTARRDVEERARLWKFFRSLP